MRLHLALLWVWLCWMPARGFFAFGSRTAQEAATTRDVTPSATSFQRPDNDQHSMPAAPPIQSSTEQSPQAASPIAPQTRIGVFNVLQRILDSRETTAAAEAKLTIPADNATGIHARPEDIAALSQVPNATTNSTSAAGQDTIPDAIRQAPFGEVVYTTPERQAAPAPAPGAGSVFSSTSSTSSTSSSAEAWYTADVPVEGVSSAAAGAQSLAGPQGGLGEGPRGAWYPGAQVLGRLPTWAGQPIQHVRKQEAQPKPAGALPMDVTSLEELGDLTDEQLYQIFHNGTADVPADLPGKEGATVCPTFGVLKKDRTWTCF